MSAPFIHWFRRDLRLSDNLALDAAARAGSPILPVFILDPALVQSPRVSLPRLAFLLRALESLDRSLRVQGSRLLIGYGDPRRLLPALVQSSGATAVFTNQDYTPLAGRRDQAVEAALGVPLHPFDDAVLLPPGSVLTESGRPFTVFTPFKKKWLTFPKPECVPAPAIGAFLPASELPTGEPWREAAGNLSDLGHPPTLALPAAGEEAAQSRLEDFLSARIFAYSEGRNRLAALSEDDTTGGSSFLSPYLRLGMLSPRQAYWAARDAFRAASGDEAQKGVETWVSELIWREFYLHILYHFPHVLSGAFRPEYDALEWRYAPDELAAWKEGMTGYPVVDAAMRQLRQMGWMPNRARMIVASFLAKDLLIHWQEGERHFMDWLIDGDPAANNGGWQWSAGTGTDAQPYFRIFNPVSQGQKFDPEGRYVRRWVPELGEVPDAFIHAPWEMPTPPSGYPRPLVDRNLSRERTMAAFQKVKGGSRPNAS